MKKTKVIIPALGLLVLSTAASVTGTVAWFSANATVTATGMTVTAQSDSKLLVINYGATFDNTNESTTAASTHAATNLYPVAPATTLTSGNVTTASSWHYGYSAASNDPTLNGNYIVCTDLTNYVVSETFSIGLSNKSGLTSATNLKLSALTLPANTGISCVVVCGSNCWTHLSEYPQNATAPSLPEALAATVDTNGVQVTIHYFINGDDSHVYTNNISALTGLVSFTFSID